MFDVITVGGVSRDIFFETSDAQLVEDPRGVHDKLLAFDYGAKIIPEKAFFAFGGGAYNASVCFRKFDLNVGPVFAIGKDGSGSSVLEDLKSKGIDTSLIFHCEDHTALSLFVNYQDDHVGFLHRGANDFLRIADYDKLQTRWFYISSLTGESAAILPQVIKKADEMGSNVAFNPGSVQLKEGYHYLKSIFEKVHIVILNLDEAEELVRSGGKFNTDDPKTLLWEIYKMGPKNVILTAGEKGSYFTNGTDVRYEKAFKAKVLETTGAGDSFGSSFVACLIKGYNYVEAHQMAAINSASVVEHVGAQAGLLSEGEIKKRMEKSRV